MLRKAGERGRDSGIAGRFTAKGAKDAKNLVFSTWYLALPKSPGIRDGNGAADLELNTMYQILALRPSRPLR